MSRKGLSALLCLVVFILLPLPASASFHLVKIVEVFPGTAAEPTAQYVVLQMYFAGQNFVKAHSLTVYDAAGTKVGTFTFGGNVSKGTNLAAMLIATPAAEELFGINGDLMMTPVIQADGGAVCWDVVDCVAWGGFSGANALPVPPGPPFNAPDGLILDMAMHRDLSSGGAVTSFVFAAPAPKNNAGQTGATGPTPTSTPTVTPTPVVTATVPPCLGDCDGDLHVAVDEVITLVNIALGSTPIAACEPADANMDGEITVNEIVAAVHSALTGCVIG